MSGYRIYFFKNLVNSDGHPFKCLQSEIFLHSETPAEAMERASRQFASMHGVRDWKIFADVMEVAPTAEGVAPVLSASTVTPATRAA